MAIIKLGTTVVGIRGTIAGITYSENQSGTYARLWAKGSNPSSAYQTQTRGRITTLSTLWLSMTDALRADWRTFAATPPETDYNSLGELILLSGWMWFVRVNQRRQSVGLATTTTVPSSAPQSPPASAALALAQLPGGTCTITWPSATFGAGTSADLYLAVHTTAGLLTKNSQRLLTFALRNPADTHEHINTQITARFGYIRTSWKFFGFLYKLRDDGVRSIAATTSTVVT